MRYLTVLSIGALGLLLAQTGDARAEAAMRKVSRQFFIENRGQWHPDVLYLYRGGGMDAWITRDGVVYDFYQYREAAVRPPLAMPERKLRHGKFDKVPKARYGHVVRLRHVGGNRSPQPVGQDRQPGYYNYFLGSDPTRWVLEVPLYGEVEVREVYPGIHQRWYFDGGWLRYDYIVSPGADATRLRFAVEGADWVRAEGDKLVLGTRFGAVEQAGLYVYQGRERISAQWVVEGSEVSIAVGSYDRTQPLIIDPLVWSTFLGGSGSDEAYSLAVDGSGAVYVTGSTTSMDFPTTTGSYNPTHNGGNCGGYTCSDVFITKINQNGSRLIWSTFLGGSSYEHYTSIAVDRNGAVYVAGSTGSSNFPTTTGSFSQTHKSGYDIFVSKLNSNGNALIWSTLIGGDADDMNASLAVDATGAVYVTGSTGSTDFPTTPGSYDRTHNGSFDAFVTKINSTGSMLVWSTLLGGSDRDEALSLAVDVNGAVYVTGITYSSDFPTRAGSYDQTYNGGTCGMSPYTYPCTDAFVVKLSPNGSSLVWSTYLGGTNNDGATSIAVDGSGAVYVAGWTASSDFPTTVGSYDQTYNGGMCGTGSSTYPCEDAFVTKINSNGATLIWSTFLGGGNDDWAVSLAVDVNGVVYVMGGTYSPDYPTTRGSYDQVYNGESDVFISKLGANGNNLLWSTYLGGQDADWGYFLGIDGSGAVYVTGNTASSDFPTTAGSYMPTITGGGIFVTKLCSEPMGCEAPTSLPLGRGLESWLIYPNPNLGTFFMEIWLGRKGIFDILEVGGQIIHTWESEDGVYHMKLSLPAGVYFIRERESGSVKRLVIVE